MPGLVLPDGGVVVLPEGEVGPLEDCDGPAPAALDPEPPQPASAITASATASVRRGCLEWRRLMRVFQSVSADIMPHPGLLLKMSPIRDTSASQCDGEHIGHPVGLHVMSCRDHAACAVECLRCKVQRCRKSSSWGAIAWPAALPAPGLAGRTGRAAAQGSGNSRISGSGDLI